MTLKDAQAIVDGIQAWCGGDQWDDLGKKPFEITLDGVFTLEQLEALIIVLREKVAHLTEL